MPRSIRAEAETCQWTANASQEQWWDNGESEWTDGPAPGDTVDFNSKTIEIDANIDLRNYTIQGSAALLRVNYGYTVYTDGIGIGENYGTVHLLNGTLTTNYGTVYVYGSPNAASVVNMESGSQVIIAHPTGVVYLGPNGTQVSLSGGANVTAGNIKKDVTILGVTGNLTPGGGVVRVGD